MAVDNTLIGALVIILIGLTVIGYFNWANTRDARKHTKMMFKQQHIIKSYPDAHRLSQAVHILHPAARLGFDYVISLDDGNLPYLSEWNTSGPMPTQGELDQALKKVTAIDCTGYAAMRRSEYPSIEDQLDAAFKARRGDSSEQDELDDRIDQIKNKYPKSDEAL